MNIWQQFLHIIGAERTAPISEAARVKAMASVYRPAWESTQPTYVTSANFDILVKEGYHKNELIFACIARWAVTGAQISLTMQERGSKETVDAHPVLALMRKPNPNMSEAEFWASVMQYQKLAGRAIYEIERSNGGEPIALWPLRPDLVKAVPARNRPIIAEYIYTVEGQEFRLKPRDVLDFPLFDPRSMYTSYPPVAVAARVGDVDNDLTDFVKLLMEHGGMPMGVLKTTMALSEDEVISIRERWRQTYGGYENWVNNIGVLDRDASYQQTGLSMPDMGFEVLDARDEARICEVLDIPPILVGAKIGLDKATYSNYETAQKVWWLNSVIPTYETFLDTLNTQLLPQYPNSAGRYTLIWDKSQVPALQQNVNELWVRTWAGWTAGGLTLAQVHSILGLELPGGVKGDYYLRDASKAMVFVEDTAKKPEPAPVPALPAPETTPETEPEEETEDNEGEDETMGDEEEGDEMMQGKAAPVRDESEKRDELETGFIDALDKFYSGQLERINRRLREEFEQ